jgi:sigma-B regulation protein RsbU (phosphoserine phosphatase)
MIEPAREVGGDLYDLFFLDENRLAMTVGDVSGKGIPAALFMAVTRTLLRALAFQIPEPAELLAELNNRLSEDNPSNMFVTLFYGVLDLRTGALVFASGGHNPPLLVDREGRAGTLPRVKGVALGVFAGVPYQEEAASIGADDHLLLFTDGLTEAMNAAGDLYGDDRALATVAKLARLEPKELIAELRKDVAEHVAGAEPSDDLTLLDLQYTPA